MKIMIVGDVHNEFGILNNLINKKKPDLIIACGDFGYWPRFNNKPRGGTKSLSEIKLQTAQKLLWIDGNHEDFWSLRNRDSDEIEPGIIYMPRGSTYKLPDGRKILFMGGANSIDKHLRTVGIDWFPEETIKYSDFENLPDDDIDIFITHTCPSELVEKLKLRYYSKDREPSNIALSGLWDIYKPKLWIFGHWHQYLEIEMNNTQFYCLSAAGFYDKWWMWLPEKKEK